MNIKKFYLIILILLCIVGCTNINELSYDEIINNFSIKEKMANTFKKGYKFYTPKGLLVEDGGSNFDVLRSSDITYYLYVDLISYNSKKYNDYEINTKAIYSKKINSDNKLGYVEIELKENNQYLIEIMYNYAKIEVMVDESLINKALINCISILDSVKYNDLVIKELLESDELNYTEENYELFDENKSNSNILDYSKEESDLEEDIIDTDYIN